jgi:hypothetical protein
MLVIGVLIYFLWAELVVDNAALHINSYNIWRRLHAFTLPSTILHVNWNRCCKATEAEFLSTVRVQFYRETYRSLKKKGGGNSYRHNASTWYITRHDESMV